MKKLIKLYVIALCLVSCGKSEHHIKSDLPDRIDIVHSFDLSALETEFINECTENYDTQEEIDQCVEDKIEDVLDIIDKLLNENEVENGNKK